MPGGHGGMLQEGRVDGMKDHSSSTHGGRAVLTGGEPCG